MKKLLFAAFLVGCCLSSLGQITITSQAEIDAWTADNVTNLTITGPNITSLQGLSSLNYAGTLTIETTYNLTSLDGLENITEGFNLKIQDNQALVDASAIEEISLSFLRIRDNPLLNSIGNFAGTEIMEEVAITNNPNLSINGLFSIVPNVYSVEFEGPTLGGFNNLNSLQYLEFDADEVVGFQNLETVTNLEQDGAAYFPSLTSIQYLSIGGTAAIDNFSGFPAVESIEEIDMHSILEDFNFQGLSSIQTIGSIGVTIATSDFDFTGLEGITEMDGVYVGFCQGQVSLQGLNSIVNLWEGLNITHNDHISSLEGLESLSYAESIQVNDNPELVLCCNFSPSLLVGSFSVDNNASAQCNDISLWSLQCGNFDGCTDQNACNYDPAATQDDGSCLIEGTACDDSDPFTENDVITDQCECAGETFELVWGCTYPVALNFDPNANMDNGSCTFIECLDNNDGDLDGNQIVGVEDLLMLLQNFGNIVD